MLHDYEGHSVVTRLQILQKLHRCLEPPGRTANCDNGIFGTFFSYLPLHRFVPQFRPRRFLLSGPAKRTTADARGSVSLGRAFGGHLFKILPQRWIRSSLDYDLNRTLQLAEGGTRPPGALTYECGLPPNFVLRLPRDLMASSSEKPIHLSVMASALTERRYGKDKTSRLN